MRGREEGPGHGAGSVRGAGSGPEAGPRWEAASCRGKGPVREAARGRGAGPGRAGAWGPTRAARRTQGRLQPARTLAARPWPRRSGTATSWAGHRCRPEAAAAEFAARPARSTHGGRLGQGARRAAGQSARRSSMRKTVRCGARPPHLRPDQLLLRCERLLHRLQLAHHVLQRGRGHISGLPPAVTNEEELLRPHDEIAAVVSPRRCHAAPPKHNAPRGGQPRPGVGRRARYKACRGCDAARACQGARRVRQARGPPTPRRQDKFREPADPRKSYLLSARARAGGLRVSPALGLLWRHPGSLEGLEEKPGLASGNLLRSKHAGSVKRLLLIGTVTARSEGRRAAEKGDDWLAKKAGLVVRQDRGCGRSKAAWSEGEGARGNPAVRWRPSPRVSSVRLV